MIRLVIRIELIFDLCRGKKENIVKQVSIM